MEARRCCATFLLAMICLISVDSVRAASDRTENFIVNAPSREFAREVAQLAERYRRDLAIEWLGQELPRWHQPCPISVRVGKNMGAGGATSFMFDRGRPFGWRMSIQGSPERILDSVLPHEVTHTIFATYFGRPLPRWADEGACTAVEHPSEKSKQESMLNQFLRSKPSRGIPFNRMYAMREYPSDIMPLYSQGFSLVRYLLHHGGKRKFVQYLGEGMQYENWDAVTQKYYGFEDLSELQLDWVDWVAAGSPSTPDRSQIASTSPVLPPVGSQVPERSRRSDAPPREFVPSSDLVAIQPARDPGASDSRSIQPVSFEGQDSQPRFASLDSETVTRGQDSTEDSWYARQRDKFRDKSIFNIGRSEDGSRVAFSSFASLAAMAKSFTKPEPKLERVDLVRPEFDLDDPVPPPPAVRWSSMSCCPSHWLNLARYQSR